MATRKQVSDILKSIWLSKQMKRILGVQKYTENTNIIVAVVYSTFLFLIKLNFRKQIVIFYN